MPNSDKSNFRALWYKGQDGLNLFSRDYSEHYKGPSDRAAIICIHGLTRNSADYASVCERLCSSYPVYAVDVRGRGRSDYDSNSSNYQVFTYLSDIKAFVDFLNLQSVILIGTSMGGFISMMFAAVATEKVKGIVLNDIGPEVNAGGLRRINDYISKPPQVATWDDAVRETKRLNEKIYPDFGSADWLGFAKNLYQEDEKGVPVLDYDEHIVDLFKQAPTNSTDVDFWPTFSLIRSIPLLLVRGAMSDILDFSCVLRMQKEHSNLSYLEIPYRGHTPFLNEKECEEAIDEFLKAIE